MLIPFNKPFLTGKEAHYIFDAVYNKMQISGNGVYSKKCNEFFEKRYDIKKCLLTTSCTDALEMCALLLNIKPGDEIIIPSYTFVSTALAFVREGAKIIFADSRSDHPGIDEDKIESLITERTKAIVPVHYAGVACDMGKIMKIADKYQIKVIEDAAHSIDSQYKDQALGSIGHLSAFSFHETKNVIAGEGGMIGINDDEYLRRAEILWEKGTNRAEFFRGEVDKYNWVDTGSSFLPSDLIAAFLYAQTEQIEVIQQRRKQIWERYYSNFKGKVETYNIQLPVIPDYAMNNAHMFYIVCESLSQRSEIIAYLKKYNIHCAFHYISLHQSPYYKDHYAGEALVNSDRFTDCLVRLPFYYELKDEEIDLICELILEYLSRNSYERG